MPIINIAFLISSYLHLYNKETIPEIQPKPKKSLLSIASDLN